MKSIQEVAVNVMDESIRAREMWGAAFDEKNTLNDWAAYVNIYLGKATSMGATPEEVKRGLRKAAGLVLSALCQAENGGFAPRHYDNGQPRPASLPEITIEGEGSGI